MDRMTIGIGNYSLEKEVYDTLDGIVVIVGECVGVLIITSKYSFWACPRTVLRAK